MIPQVGVEIASDCNRAPNGIASKLKDLLREVRFSYLVKLLDRYRGHRGVGTAMVPEVDDVLLAFGLCLGKGPTLDSITFAITVAEDGEDPGTGAFSLLGIFRE
jgi:hypothetical protein